MGNMSVSDLNTGLSDLLAQVNRSASTDLQTVLVENTAEIVQETTAAETAKTVAAVAQEAVMALAEEGTCSLTEDVTENAAEWLPSLSDAGSTLLHGMKYVVLESSIGDLVVDGVSALGRQILTQELAKSVAEVINPTYVSMGLSIPITIGLGVVGLRAIHIAAMKREEWDVGGAIRYGLAAALANWRAGHEVVILARHISKLVA